MMVATTTNPSGSTTSPGSTPSTDDIDKKYPPLQLGNCSQLQGEPSPTGIDGQFNVGPDDDVLKTLDGLGEELKSKETALSSHKREEVLAKAKKAVRMANQKYEETMQGLNDARDGAETQWKLAQKKYSNAVRLLTLQTNNDIEELGSAYNQCQDSAAGAKLPDRKKAICTAQYYQDRADKEVTFQKGMQKSEQTLAAAYSDWVKAQAEFQSAQCSAKADKKKALQAAMVVLFTDINQELEKLQ